MIHFLEATVKRSEENQYRSWGYCTYEVQWNDHSLKFTIFYSKILGDWNRRIFSDKVSVPRPHGFPWGPRVGAPWSPGWGPMEPRAQGLLGPMGLRGRMGLRGPMGLR